jgi:hypothetical protein
VSSGGALPTVATSRENHRSQTIDRAASNSRKSETIAARRPNSFPRESVVFAPPGCLTQPPPRNRVSRGRYLLGGDRPLFQRSSSRLRLRHVCRMNIPCRRSWPWFCGRQRAERPPESGRVDGSGGGEERSRNVTCLGPYCAGGPVPRKRGMTGVKYPARCSIAGTLSKKYCGS